MKPTMIALSIVLIFSPVSSVLAANTSPERFVQKAGQSDMFEIEAAKLVLAEGKSDEVKAFAKDMVKDHGKSTQGLHDAAAKEGIALPSSIGPELSKKMDSLKPLKGPALDAAYVSTQVSVHTAAVELFENYSKDGRGGALKSFAQQTYPTIRMHLIRVRNFNVEE